MEISSAASANVVPLKDPEIAMSRGAISREGYIRNDRETIHIDRFKALKV